MSDFAVKIERITLEPHPNADALEVAKVKGHTCIVQKGIHSDGDLIAYIPEQAVIPGWLIDHMNLQGRLAGKDKNRVKAIRLRGVYSEGLVLPLIHDEGHTFLPAEEEDGYEWVVHEGMDVTEHLGVIKYEAPIPAALAGCAGGSDFDMTIKYDFNSIESDMDLFQEGEGVVATEKIHGTCAITGVAAERFREKYGDRLVDGYGISTSKGLSDKGIFLDGASEQNSKNTYINVAKQYDLYAKLRKWFEEVYPDRQDENVFIIGEIYGPKIQDLTYAGEISYRAFDIYIGSRQGGEFLTYDDFTEACDRMRIPTVPLVYNGPYNYEKICELSRGKSVVAEPGTNKQDMIEGVVVKGLDGACRKIAKRVGEQYKLRKNATEYN